MGHPTATKEGATVYALPKRRAPKRRAKGEVTRIRFTAARLDALPRPAAGQQPIYTYDVEQPRLAISVSATGVKTFYLVKKVRGEANPRHKLERYGVIGIDDARSAAQALLTKLAAGENIASTRRAMRDGVTLQDVFDDFLEHRRNKRGDFLGDVTKRGYSFDFKNHLGRLADKVAGNITREQVAALHSRIGREHPTTANRVLALVSSLYSHADRRKLCVDHNPARGIEKFPEQARERFLQQDEFAPFMKALAATPTPWRWVFSLALFTGARRSNVLAAKWPDIDLAMRLWRMPTTKAGKSVTIPLSDEARAVLKQIPRIAGTDYVFPTLRAKKGPQAPAHLTEPKKAWSDLVARADLDDLKIHDLRRTLGSWQAIGGASLPVIGKSLGHSTAQSTEVYARLSTQPVADSVAKATAGMLAAARKGNKGAAIRKVLGSKPPPTRDG